MRLPLLLLASVTGCGPMGARAPVPRQDPVLHVRGSELADGAGRPVVLRGVAFGNQVWQDVRIPASTTPRWTMGGSPRWA